MFVKSGTIDSKTDVVIGKQSNEEFLKQKQQSDRVENRSLPVEFVVDREDVLVAMI